MKKERKVIDAHLHIFGHCEFGDRLAHGIGDEPTQEYLTEKYYGRLGIEKGIVMGNGPLEEQGKNLGEYFYYSAGLDEKDSWLKLEEIESHLQRKRCVGVKLYPGYYELYPNDKSLYPIYKMTEEYGKVLSVHTEMALLDTHYYGGVKKYQWVTLPLALHGVICKKDGTTVTVNIGEKPEDPVFGVSDLLIHLAGEQMEKKASKVIEGENLDLLVGSIPAAGDDEKEKKEMKDRVKANILNILSKEYGVDEEDFLSAEIEVVPAGAARDYGFDRSMIMGYGHDDRVCAYPSFAAMLEIEKPQHTSVCLLVDKEEIGSVGASGMQSHFFEDSVAEIINLLGEYSELKVRRALHNSRVLSSDVSAAFDPNYPSVMEKRNCAYFGKGLVLNKYTGARGKSGSNDANAEYIARLRRIFDDNDVSFQTSELGKVDQGGGGTIAYILANYGMNVIDSGVAVLNMHAPWEIISKVDLYEALHGYVAFLKEA